MAKKERIVWIDQIKAVAFFFVIMCHMDIAATPKSWVYAFHMPLYLFVHGATLNIEKIYNTDFKSYFSKHFQRTVIPFLWLNFLMLFFRVIWHTLILGQNYTIGEHIKGIFVVNGKLVPIPAGELYFILLIFLSDIGLFFAIRLAKKDYMKILGILAAFSTISLMTPNKAMPLRITSVPVAMLQIFIGRLLMNVYLENKEKLEKMKIPFYWAIIVCLGAIGTALWKYNGRYSLSGNHYGKDFLIAVVCAVFLSSAIAMIVMKLPKMNIIVEIGQNTVFYLGTHQFLISVTEKIFKPYKGELWFVLLSSVIILFALYPPAKLCKRFCPYILGAPLDEDTKGTVAGKIVCIASCTLFPSYWFVGRFFGLKGTALYIVTVILFAAVSAGAYFIFKRFPFVYIQQKPKAKIQEN